MGLAEGAQPLLDQGRVGQHPAVQGGVVHLQTALQKQLLDVAIAERVAQVPRDGLQDQRCLEVPALEIVLRPALQLLDKGVQEHRPPPGWRRQSRPTCLTDRERQTLRHAPFQNITVAAVAPSGSARDSGQITGRQASALRAGTTSLSTDRASNGEWEPLLISTVVP